MTSLLKVYYTVKILAILIYAKKGKNTTLRSEYIRQAIAGERLLTAAYAMVGSRLAADVREYSNGKIDNSGAYMELVANDVKYAYEEHLEAKEAGDIDLSIRDFLNIADYVNEYSELVYVKQYKDGKTRLAIQKTMPNGELPYCRRSFEKQKFHTI